MINFYTNVLHEVVVSPRKSARRILDADLENKDLVLVLATSYALGMVLTLLTLLSLDQTTAALPSMPVHVVGVALTVVTIGLISALIWSIGNRLGGTASFIEVVRVVLWQFFIMSFLTPLEIWAQLGIPTIQDGTTIDVANISPVVLGVYGVLFGVQLYLLANFIAEVHSFKSVSKVAMGLVSASLLLAVLLGVSVAG